MIASVMVESSTLAGREEKQTAAMCLRGIGDPPVTTGVRHIKQPAYATLRAANRPYVDALVLLAFEGDHRELQALAVL
jgi:hypothetical protein